MNELIKISERNGYSVVSARELYKILGYDDTQFSRWSESKILLNEFAIENIDYQCLDMFVEMPNGGKRIIMDFAVSVDFAKKLAMLSKTKGGEEIRNYFIECEKRLKQFQLPKTFSEALQLAADQAKQIELQQSQIKELEPKAEVYESISNAENLLTLNDTAKSIGIGRNILMRMLREKNILRKNNTPYQQYIDSGYFEVKVKPIKIGDSETNYVQTFVTGKGLTWLSKIFICK